MARYQDISLSFGDLIDTPVTRRQKVEEASRRAQQRLAATGGPFAALASGIAGSLPGITENVRTTARDAGFRAFETPGERLAQKLQNIDFTKADGRDEAVRLVSQFDPVAGANLENTYAERELAIQTAQNRFPVESERYANGTTYLRTSRGITQVRLADGTLLTKPEEIGRAIREGRQSDIDDRAAQAQATAEGAATVEELQEIKRKINTAYQKADRSDQFIEALNQGADQTLFARLTPEFLQSQATIEYRQLAQEAGLDIVGATTFGALSRGELNLALDVAVPSFGSNQQALDYFYKRKQAQLALAREFERYFDFVQSQGGRLVSGRGALEEFNKTRTPTADPSAARPDADVDPVARFKELDKG